MKRWAMTIMPRLPQGTELPPTKQFASTGTRVSAVK
jgi:hypothetical protein